MPQKNCFNIHYSNYKAIINHYFTNNKRNSYTQFVKKIALKEEFSEQMNVLKFRV